MSDFYITKILATGSGKKDSFIELRQGLNLIKGRSNTGKTCIIKCIDYCFGSSTEPFDRSFGYTTVTLFLTTSKGKIQISRQLGKNKVDVVTDVSGHDNGVYTLKENPNKKIPDPLLSDLLLDAIGIDAGTYIFRNAVCDTQKMTWRTILPLLLFHVKDIVKETSVVEPTQNTAKTAFFSALLLLLNGKGYLEADKHTKKEIRKAQKAAVEKYINEKISFIADKKKMLENNLSVFDGINVEEKIQEVLDSIQEAEEEIANATKQSKEILGEIVQLREHAAECNLLEKRYKSLHEQYLSDMKRLSFIANSESALNNMPHNDKCPFCEGHIPEKQRQSYIKPAQSELNRITRQLNGLMETENELLGEKDEIKEQLIKLEKERADINFIIQGELQPRVAALKSMHENYCKYIKIKHEVEVIADFSKGYVGDLSNLPSEDESTPEFHPKEHFAGDFQSKMDELVLDILTECNFPNLVAARFNLASFDVEVNGHKKESFQGQGYSSFLNSVVAVAFRQYLFDKATHDPGVLIIDTPLLELDQGVGDASPDSMRTALYTYFAKHQDCGQIILFDNIKNIPDVDFESFGTNVITFTKGYMQGRYGFLLDVTE